MDRVAGFAEEAQLKIDIDYGHATKRGTPATVNAALR